MEFPTEQSFNPGITKQAQFLFLQTSELTVHPSLTLRDIIYDQGYKVLLHQKLESIQYNTVLLITGTIRGTSRA